MKHRVNEQLLGEKLKKCETSPWENTEKHGLQTALALNLLLGMVQRFDKCIFICSLPSVKLYIDKVCPITCHWQTHSVLKQ